MDGSFIQKYFFSTVLIVACALGFVLFWPFLKVIILAVIFSVLLHPVFRWFSRRTRFPKLASLLTLISFVVMLCVPLYFIGDVVLKQSHSMYAWVISHGSIETITQDLSIRLHHLFPTLSFNIRDHVNSAISSFTAGVGTLFTATVATLISFILMLLSMFYFLKDGAAWKEALIQLSPLSLESNITIVTTLKRTITGIFKGYFIVGLAQGVTTGIGLYLFHVPHPALWGLLAVFTSFVPTIGSSLVAIPSALFLFAIGRTGAGIGYAIWAIACSVTIDNVLSPYVVGRQIAIHPLLVLFSILGGVILMGPIGFVAGPLLISFIYALISVYKMEMVTEITQES